MELFGIFNFVQKVQNSKFNYNLETKIQFLRDVIYLYYPFIGEKNIKEIVKERIKFNKENVQKDTELEPVKQEQVSVEDFIIKNLDNEKQSEASFEI